MTAAGHAVLGTIIAAKVANPYLAIPLALASHLAADAFPHWDAGTNRRKKNGETLLVHAVIDVIFGFVISFLLIAFLFPKTNLSYAFGLVIIAQAFDWATAPYYLFHMKNPPFLWFYRFQKIFHRSLDKPWGIINQVAVLVLLVILAKIF